MYETLFLDLPDLNATQGFGRQLGQRLSSGSIVALIGELGAGKTHLVRAIAEGLGVTDSRVVTSPTFVLVQEYAARLPIFHFDAYRLKTETEFADLGVHEYFASDGVCLIEWADRISGCLPAEHLQITLAVTGTTSRHLTVIGKGAGYEKLVKEFIEVSVCPRPKQA
jgi:tRNA threonylcarbamoyladenosine biosynthesis protein TsaE